MRIKHICLLCVLLALVPVMLAACGGDNRPQNTDTDLPGTAEVTDVQTQKAKLMLVENGKTAFKIIYPDEPGKELFDAVSSMVAAIEKATGVKPAMGNDLLKWGQAHDAGAYEILVGGTNYDETQQVLDGLKIGDYAITLVGNKVVVAGRTEEMTLRAISYFTKNLIKTVIAPDGSLRLPYEEYIYLSVPAVESLAVCGVEMKDMKIVYATAEQGYDRAAQQLSDAIAARYGYVLEVVADRDTASAAGEVLVGPTNRTESTSFIAAHKTGLLEFAMGVQDGKLCVCGGPYSCVQAAQRFSSRYLYSDNKKVNIEAGEYLGETMLSRTQVALTAGADLRVMTANILAEMESWGGTTPVYERAEIFAAVLDVFSPDVVGVQEVTKLWDKMIPYYSSNTYSFLYMTTPDGITNYSTILYKKDKYTIVDSGVLYYSNYGKNNIRLVTWGVFEDKETGDRFALFNTHWCWDYVEHARVQANEEANLIKQIRTNYNCPVFCTADYNTIQEAENYNLFLSAAGLADAKYMARDAGTLINKAGGCGELGSPRLDSGNSIDHIIITPECGVLAFETVIDNHTWDISDHSPKYADIKLPK